jgi:hypothetical protein
MPSERRLAIDLSQPSINSNVPECASDYCAANPDVMDDGALTDPNEFRLPSVLTSKRFIVLFPDART